MSTDSSSTDAAKPADHSGTVATQQAAPIVAAKQPKTVKDWLQTADFQKAMSQVLPKHLSPERQARIALAALTRNPRLAECTPASVLRCMLDLSAAGLEADGRRAYLIPFKDSRAGGYVCTLILGYQGLVEMAMNSGRVSNIHADVVCEHDSFEADTGNVSHKVDYRKPRGDVFAAYCRVTFKDGGSKSEVMSLEELNAIRGRSKTSGSGPWVTDTREMMKKTVARRCLKWVPLSPEIREAIEREDEAIDVETVKTPQSIEEVFAEQPALPAGESLPMDTAN